MHNIWSTLLLETVNELHTLNSNVIMFHIDYVINHVYCFDQNII